jgi:hypothetical protein
VVLTFVQLTFGIILYLLKILFQVRGLYSTERDDHEAVYLPNYLESISHEVFRGTIPISVLID